MEYWIETTGKVLVILGLLFPSSALANVSPIKKGDPAPDNGFFFDPDSERQAENYRDDATYYKALSDKLQEKVATEADESQILEKRLQLYITESQDLSKITVKKDTTEDLIRIAYFFGGVFVTALVVRNTRP